MSFKANKMFRKEYDRLFKKDPIGANLFLLLAELADKKGQIVTDEKELAELMAVRFRDPSQHALGGMKDE